MQIVIIAGGLGERLKHRTGNEIPKALLKLNGKPLIYYCIKLYSEYYKDFILLLGHGADKIVEYVGDGLRFGINVKYSIEKEKLGKAGAIKQALDNGIIDRTQPCIITYPDDLILNPDFPIELFCNHRIKKSLSTIVRVDKTIYKYGVVEVNNKGKVVNYQEKPTVDIPANVGIYILEPEIYNIIDALVLSKPTDFEEVVVPELVKLGILNCFTIPFESWIPVNEEKEFKQAEKVISTIKSI